MCRMFVRPKGRWHWPIRTPSVANTGSSIRLGDHPQCSAVCSSEHHHKAFPRERPGRRPGVRGETVRPAGVHTVRPQRDACSPPNPPNRHCICIRLYQDRAKTRAGSFVTLPMAKLRVPPPARPSSKSGEVLGLAGHGGLPHTLDMTTYGTRSRDVCCCNKHALPCIHTTVPKRYQFKHF